MIWLLKTKKEEVDKLLRTKREIEIDKAKRDLLVCFENNGMHEADSYETAVVLGAYVICKILRGDAVYKNGMSDEECIDSIEGISESLRNLLLEMFSIRENESYVVRSSTVERLISIANRYNEKTFKDIVLNLEDIGSFGLPKGAVPSSIVKLAMRILDIKSGDNVADLCCGRGDFITTASIGTPRASYTGVELNYKNLAIAEMRSDILGRVFSLHIGTPFSWYSSNPTGQFNKIFSLHPFGVKAIGHSDMEIIRESMSAKMNCNARNISSDWFYTEAICNLLAEGGKAVTVMSDASTWSQRDQMIRRYYAENGLVEAVISLPERMLYGTFKKTTLLVLSSGNEKIRFIDASSMCSSDRGLQGRRVNTFSDNNINEIINALSGDESISVLADINSLRENDYSFATDRYIEEEYSVENGVCFGDIIKHVTRGAMLTASELDAITSTKPTQNRYLRISDIQNDIISDDLPFIEAVDERLRKYCLKDGDLILSKIGYPQKICVAEVKEDTTILATGNLYIITLDQEKVEPYYLKAFFKSRKGQAALKSITSGAAMPSISVGQLKSLVLPLPDMTKQKKIAIAFEAAEDEVRVLTSKINKAIERLSVVFEEEVDG